MSEGLALPSPASLLLAERSSLPVPARRLALGAIRPLHMAAWIEQLGGSAPTVKQKLAAVRMLFDWLVTGGALGANPAAAVRGPKHVVKVGKTPVLQASEARALLDSIPLDIIGGLRDRAMIGVMIYSFARVGAVVGMRVEDYYVQGRRGWFRLHEKGGKHHQVPAHHNAEAYVEAYLEAAGPAFRAERRQPLFPALDCGCGLSARPFARPRCGRWCSGGRARPASAPRYPATPSGPPASRRI